MGPMMLQQRAECRICNGMGYQLQTESVQIEVHIPIGARHAESYTVVGEGNRYPDHTPGDVIVQFKLLKHELYKRQGADLGMNHTLSLRQALCGYLIKVKHVSGKTLFIRPKNDNEIVQPGSLKCIYTMGMPQRFAPHIKGHLYIVMEVEMPMSKSLSLQVLRQFASQLPDTEVVNDFGDECIDNKVNDVSGKQQQKQKPNKKNKKRKNNNRKKQRNKNSMKNMFGGLYDNNNKNSKKQRKRNSGSGDSSMVDISDDENEDVYEDVRCTDVDDNPKATPASARGMFEEEDERDGVQCKQM